MMTDLVFCFKCCWLRLDTVTELVAVTVLSSHGSTPTFHLSNTLQQTRSTQGMSCGSVLMTRQLVVVTSQSETDCVKEVSAQLH